MYAFRRVAEYKFISSINRGAKRNTYNLPLSSKDLNLNKEIEYSYWDAESQCEISVSDKDIDMLQNRFRFE